MRVLCFMLLAAIVGQTQTTRQITLEEALDLTRKNNAALKIARLRVEEADRRRLAARANYYPRLDADANYLRFSETLGSELTFGGSTPLPLPIPLPSIPIPINLVKQNLFVSNVIAAQPLTQLFRAKQGVTVAASDRDISKAQAERTERELLYAVEQLYCGILIAQRKKIATELKIAAAEEGLREATDAVETGVALTVATLGKRAQFLETRQESLALETQIVDLTQSLSEQLGLPLDTKLELKDPSAMDAPPSLDEAIRQASIMNNEIAEGRLLVTKARAGVRAAKQEYIPDVTAVGSFTAQTGVPLLNPNFGAVGGRLNWQLFDGGRRWQQVKERSAQLASAEANLDRLERRIRVSVETSYRAIERSRQQIDVARQALAYRKESERIIADQVEVGVAKHSALAEARAATASSNADLLAASLAYRLAQSDLRRLAATP